MPPERRCGSVPKRPKSWPESPGPASYHALVSRKRRRQSEWRKTEVGGTTVESSIRGLTIQIVAIYGTLDGDERDKEKRCRDIAAPSRQHIARQIN